jgi:hypothetical protein
MSTPFFGPVHGSRMALCSGRMTQSIPYTPFWDTQNRRFKIGYTKLEISGAPLYDFADFSIILSFNRQQNPLVLDPN